MLYVALPFYCLQLVTVAVTIATALKVSIVWAAQLEKDFRMENV